MWSSETLEYYSDPSASMCKEYNYYNEKSIEGDYHLMTYIESISSSLSHLSEHHCVDIVVGITSLQPGM